MSSKLALGTVQFGLNYGIANRLGRVPAGEVAMLLARAAEAEVDTLDTAIAYGDSEAVLGGAGVAGWRIVTKLPALPDNVADVATWVHTEISGSLQRLGVAKVHAVLLHRPGQLFERHGTQLLGALIKLQCDGVTSKIGVSVYSPEELDALFALHPFDLVQAPLNILDRRLIESGWCARLKHAGVEIHTRSAFLQGLLLQTAEERGPKFARWNALWCEWERWLDDNGILPLQACLNYALSVEEIDHIIVGIDSLAQLNEILAAAKTRASLPIFTASHPVPSELINPATWSEL